MPTRFQLAQHLQVPCSAILATAFVLAISSSFFSLQLSPASIMLLGVRIERKHEVTTKRLHERDPRKHRVARRRTESVYRYRLATAPGRIGRSPVSQLSRQRPSRQNACSKTVKSICGKASKRQRSVCPDCCQSSGSTHELAHEKYYVCGRSIQFRRVRCLRLFDGRMLCASARCCSSCLAGEWRNSRCSSQPAYKFCDTKLFPGSLRHR